MVASDQQQLLREQRRRKRERVLIAVLLVLVAALTYVQSRVVDLADNLPLGSSILVFALINVNVLLLLLLLFLVFRNLFKLTMERRRGIWGSRLRTKLVVAFVVLSLAPTIVLFVAAFQFVGTSIDYWFSAQVENSLMEALEAGESYNRQIAQGAAHYAERLAGELETRGLGAALGGRGSAEFLEARRSQYDLSAVRLFGPDLKEMAQATQSGVHLNHLQSFPLDPVSRGLSQGLPSTIILPTPFGDFAAAVHPVGTGRGRPQAALAVFSLLPKGALARLAGVRQGLEDYRQLKSLRNPIRTNQYITLSIVTLLIIFGATWFGLYLARSITVPLMEVAQGTQRIAGGDYDFFLNLEGEDEMGTLVNAFNRMTADLKTSKARLDEAQSEMRRTNLELDQRRRHMEVVLRNVAAGVVAVDAKGVITNINPSAERMLKVQAHTVLGRQWRELLAGENLALLERLLSGLPSKGRSTVDRQVRLTLGGEYLTLMVHLGFLRDEAGQAMGMVVVFEDLTELEKAQRMAAWREVARRIAHEVKNPLTPIKLSAQRLTRRYQERLAGDDQIFLECTGTIIAQVDELKRLVNEFSTFARLPSARLAPGDLKRLTEETLTLFRSAHPDIAFELEAEEGLPIFDLDQEQLSRALINLLDNAVAAVRETAPPHLVALRLSYDDILKIVRLEVEDSGPGVPPADRLRLFEPYFTTKKGGTGLGLSIVSTIVADHHGYIRVQDNQPQGTRIIIELPVGGDRMGV